jgi:hypothetical protein
MSQKTDLNTRPFQPIFAGKTRWQTILSRSKNGFTPPINRELFGKGEFFSTEAGVKKNKPAAKWVLNFQICLQQYGTDTKAYFR